MNELGQPADFRDVETADVDGDGRIDLLFADDQQALVIALHGEHTSFPRWLRVPTEAHEQQLAAGDLDGDGSLDGAIVDLNRAAVMGSWGPSLRLLDVCPSRKRLRDRFGLLLRGPLCERPVPVT